MGVTVGTSAGAVTAPRDRMRVALPLFRPWPRSHRTERVPARTARLECRRVMAAIGAAWHAMCLAYVGGARLLVLGAIPVRPADVRCAAAACLMGSTHMQEFEWVALRAQCR